MSGQPLEVLEGTLGEPVTVQLKDGTTYRGELTGYDQHMNLVLEGVVAGSGEPDPEDLGVEPTEDTIVIRGDNVVTIKP